MHLMQVRNNALKNGYKVLVGVGTTVRSRNAAPERKHMK